MNNIKKIINNVYKKSASLNLYTSVCNAKKERVLRELAEIKSDIELAELIISNAITDGDSIVVDAVDENVGVIKK